MNKEEILRLSVDIRHKVTTDVLKDIKRNIELITSVLPDLANNRTEQMALLSIPVTGVVAALTTTMLTAGALMQKGRSGEFEFNEDDVAGAIGIAILTLYRDSGLIDVDKETLKELTQNLAEKVSDALLTVLPKHKLDIL